jgi:hypothetical protein
MKTRLIVFGRSAFAALYVSFDIANAQIFVTNFNSGTISEYDITGALINPAFVSGLGFPTGLALSGGIYLWPTKTLARSANTTPSRSNDTSFTNSRAD